MFSLAVWERFAKRADIFDRRPIFPILLLAGGIFLAMPISALAQSENEFSRVELSAGYSFLRESFNTGPLFLGPGSQGANFNGGSGQVTVNVNDWFGVAADFGGYHTNSTLTSYFPGRPTSSTTTASFATATINTDIVSYMFGPKIAYSRGGKFRPFGEILFGGARIGKSPYLFGRSYNAFSMAVGGGLDYVLSEPVALRLGEVDYLMTTFRDFVNDRQDNLRVSAGIVFRFGH